ncbi:carbohydrate-binding module family 50 protein [Sphaerulina musiva SO2202]|uniref:Carbohydrate-binding module family 50 protein n=1 Tax=Sphaerulina musiva (strain SO2202) TaxID=692275 RepID=N1QJN9_SPHMS|nr:carbohydrate-binding module family 50 protein [Sphaerulina musiva SO2202]EMF12020.1 carbohydrate-binding module family 50 protein [Sphaerulina musiva SO2202]
MRCSLLTLSALATSAVCSVLPAAYSGTLEARVDNSNCTQYCSVSAGCVCTVRPSDCSEFYTVQSGDTCLSIAKSFSSFTVTQFYKWNPNVGQTCFGLQAYVPVCINTPWYTFTPPVQPDFGTHYTPDQTPVPIMPNIVSTCQEFELIEPGKRVEDLAAENGFEVNQFAEWNGNSTTAWAAYWACVKA